MRPKERAYLNFARIFPKSYREHIGKLLVYAGEKTDADSFLGSSLMLSFIVLALVLLIPFSLFNEFKNSYLFFAVISFLLIQIIYYMVIYFKAQDRTERIEQALPDALMLISANLKAGMTPFQALRASGRKEFGPLKEEIDRATAKSLGTESFSDALTGISERIISDMLERSLKLFTTAMKSGGHLAKLLEELERDIAETKSMKKELVTNTRSYSMFIMFTGIIGTPLLMAIAIHFLSIVTNLQSRTGDVTAGFGLEFLSGRIEITTGFLSNLSIVMLILTSLLACMFLGVIKEGKAKYGLRYAPIVMAGSFLVFYLVRHFIGKLNI